MTQINNGKNLASDIDDETIDGTGVSSTGGGSFSQPRNKAPEIIHGISEQLASPPPTPVQLAHLLPPFVVRREMFSSVLVPLLLAVVV